MQLITGWHKGYHLFKQCSELLGNLIMSNKFVIPILATFLGTLVGVVGSLLAHVILVSQPVVASVNLTGIVNAFVKETAKQNLSEKEMGSRVAQFSEQLNREVEALSLSRHLILLPSEAIIAGGKDYTQDIIKKMSKEK